MTSEKSDGAKRGRGGTNIFFFKQDQRANEYVYDGVGRRLSWRGENDLFLMNIDDGSFKGCRDLLKNNNKKTYEEETHDWKANKMVRAKDVRATGYKKKNNNNNSNKKLGDFPIKRFPKLAANNTIR